MNSLFFTLRGDMTDSSINKLILEHFKCVYLVKNAPVQRHKEPRRLRTVKGCRLGQHGSAAST